MATKTFNERMKQARDEAGLSLMDTVFELRGLLPRSMWISVPTLQRIESEKDETNVDAFLVCVLAGVYGVSVSDLSEEVADHLDSLRALLKPLSRCRETSAA